MEFTKLIKRNKTITAAIVMLIGFIIFDVILIFKFISILTLI